MTAAWSESRRILKPSGILAFTFHHSEDEPWVQVLESLFDAGFYLEATYPIRSDEIKGSGEFGSRKVEYDIIHVCRKRSFEPQRVSWAKMRRQILKEVSRLRDSSNTTSAKACRAPISRSSSGARPSSTTRSTTVKSTRPRVRPSRSKTPSWGVLQVLEEESTPGVEPPPVTASPFTRQLMRMFRGTSEQPLDQVQKYLRGTGISPSEFESRGWIHEDKKVYYLTPFLELAQAWHRKHRVGLAHDYDQAAVLIGACFDGSGIKAEDTLSNPNFKPHPALGALLEWFSTHSKDPEVRIAAGRADRLYRSWQARNRAIVQQLALFEEGRSRAVKVLANSTWTRRGCSLLWEAKALMSFARPGEVVSIREFIAMSREWPEDLPSNGGYALVVAGVEGCLDALDTASAQTWVERDLRKVIFEFQDEYQNDAALVLWLPSGRDRMHYALASDEYSWTGMGEERFPLGRLLWGGAQHDAHRIDHAGNGALNVVDAAGMYHPRIS